MPIIHVHLKKGTTVEYRQSIRTAIDAAMKDVPGIPYPARAPE